MTTLRPDKSFICNVTTFRAKHTQARAVARFFVTGGGGGVGGIIASAEHTCRSLVGGPGGVLPRPEDFQIWRL